LTMPLNQKPTRVLIIDDDEDDFLITSDYIKSIDEGNFTIEWCYRYADALEKIGRREHDIYFVDYRLGAKTGLDLLKDAMAMHCEDPIILLTGKGNRVVDKEAMEVGAFDYLIKAELTTDKIERCIRYALERADSLKALRANEQKYRSIFERSKDAVFITSRELAFKDINLAMSELLGYTHEELLQYTLYDLIDGEGLRNEIRKAIEETGEVNDMEIVIVDQVKEKKFCILSLSRQYDGNHGDLQGIIHDITNLKRAEKITLQAEKLAATGRLVRTLAHEVRNPLSNIHMSAEQLEASGVVKPDDKVFLEIIQRNGKRINDLITELLDSSRPTEMRYNPVSLQDVLEETIKIAHDRVTLKQIDIQVRYPEVPSVIQADVEKLKIALLNIIINATEAITHADGRIYIELTTLGNNYRVQITDNGCGISHEDLPRLFEPYFTSKRNGMGLGLASTLNILQAHRGVVDVKSQVGTGTTFLITFPGIQ
jgi:PAS domain S-box-containing protein